MIRSRVGAGERTGNSTASGMFPIAIGFGPAVAMPDGAFEADTLDRSAASRWMAIMRRELVS
jgi:hypothetical protein